MKLAKATSILSLFVSPGLVGQAWVAPRGETTVALTFHVTEFQGHLIQDGTRDPGGATRTHSLSLGIDHSLTDRLAFSASIPYVRTADTQALGNGLAVDDGNYHSAWQDFRLGARYNVLAGPVVVTPSVEFRIPSHGYRAAGEAVVGPHLREMDLGVDVGHAFADSMVYVDGRYSYALVEKFDGVGTNRSNADLDVGYFVLPTLDLRAIVHWQYTYGGLTGDQVWDPVPPKRNLNLPDRLFFNHDRLIRDRHWQAGAGASYALTPTVGVYLSGVKVISGTDSHYGYLYALGVARTFGRR